MPVTVRVSNPDNAKLMSYEPGATHGVMYRPEPSVTTDAGRIAPPEIVTVAPGSAPPETSVTMPMRRERSSCAERAAAGNRDPAMGAIETIRGISKTLDRVL